MKLSRVGVDLAKNVYQLQGVDRTGKTMLKRRLKRHQWFKVLLDKKETLQDNCLSKLHNGKQVRPASAEPGNVHVRKVRQSDWELARE